MSFTLDKLDEAVECMESSPVYVRLTEPDGSFRNFYMGCGEVGIEAKNRFLKRINAPATL